MKIFSFFLITVSFFIFSNSLFAKSEYNISIISGEYVDKEHILSIIRNLPEENIDEYINNITKKLYSLGIFSKINVFQKDELIIIEIDEYPKIISVKFLENKRFKNTQLQEIYDDYIDNIYFNPNQVDNFINSLSDLYKSFGYNQIQITYDLEKSKDTNSVILFFNIVEGSISKINKVIFEGNNSFDDKKLLELLSSKPKRDILFFLRKNYKKYIAENDIINIKDFYKNNGFKDIKVNFKEEYIESNNRFNLYYFIEENSKFNFNKFNIAYNYLELNSKQKDYINKILSNKIKKNKLLNSNYNLNITKEIRQKINDYLYSEGLIFFNVDIYEKNINQNIDIIFEISSSKIQYVNTINIYGNTRTLDKVIRREITFSEGDAVNKDLITKSTKNLIDLKIFKDVNINELRINEDTVDIEVFVEESQTGTFKLGLSVATIEGASFVAGLNEKNVGGVGRKIDFEINTSTNNNIYLLNIEEPYIFKKDLYLNYGVSYLTNDYTKSSSYKLDTISTNIGFRYDFNDEISHSVSFKYNLKDYEITNSSTVSDTILNRSGSNANFSLINSLTYNKLDSFIRPTKGNFINYFNETSPVTNSTNGYILNLLTLKKYKTHLNNIFSIQTKLGNISSLQGDEILDDNKFSLGGRWLRGFDIYGAGPRNSVTSYKGGNNLFVTKIDLMRPLNKNKENPIDLNIFTDFGTVFGNKNNPTSSEESIRSSYGFGLKFYTPIGPIGLSWAFPLQDESYDIKRMFLFNIGNLN